MTAAEPSNRRYSLAQLIIMIPWVALVIDAWAPIRDNSFLWHVRAGTLQAATGTVITEDPFSFTMLGTPWLTQSWLAELLYAWGEKGSVLGFVPPMMLLATSITFLGIGLVTYRRSGSFASTALVMILSTVLLLSFLVPRPVIFSFALFTVVVLAWDAPRFRWALPLLFWLWASVHGSFIIGLGFVGLSLLMEREWRWLPTAIISGMVTVFTAHGLGVVAILIDFAKAGDALELLSEWRRPELWSITFLPWILGLVIIVVGAARRSIVPRHLWLIVPFAALGLTSTRAVPPSWIGLLPLVALSLRGLKMREARRFSSPAAALFLVVVLVTPFLVKDDAQLDAERFPVAAIEHLGEGPLFHDDRVGGFLIWAEGPQRLVYIDDRAELYGDRMAEFVDIRKGVVSWDAAFERDGIEQALLLVSEPLAAELKAAGWTTSYENETYVVLRAADRRGSSDAQKGRKPAIGGFPSGVFVPDYGPSSPEATSLKVSETSSPAIDTAMRATMAISTTRSAYSTMEAPFSDCIHVVTLVHRASIQPLLIRVYWACRWAS